MTTVYLLTTGDYSDYTVVGAFSTEALAKEAAAKYDEDCTEVEPVELDVLDTSGRWLDYQCHLDVTGSQKYAGQKWRDTEDMGMIVRRSGMKGFGCFGPPFVGHSDRSAEDAHRLASEARQEWLRRKALGLLPEQQPIDDPPGEWKCKDGPPTEGE